MSFVGRVLALLGVLAVILATVLLPTWLVWMAWMNVAVPVFHWPSLTFFQMWLVMVALGCVGALFRSSGSGKK